MGKIQPNSPEDRPDDGRSGSPYLTPEEAAEVLRLGKATLANKRWNGTGPLFRKHGRLVRYHIDDLESWSASRKRKSTSEDGKPASGGTDQASDD